MPGQALRRAAQRGGGPEGAKGFEDGREEYGQEQQPDETGEELKDLAGAGLAERRVVDGEQIQQSQVSGVQGMRMAGQPVRHRQAEDAGGESGQ